MQLVVDADRRIERHGGLPVEQLDVAAQRAALVDDPAAQSGERRLQRPDGGSRRLALDLDGPDAAGKLPDRSRRGSPLARGAALPS